MHGDLNVAFHLHVRLCCEVVDFIRLHTSKHVDEVACVSQVAIMQKQTRFARFRSTEIVMRPLEEVLQKLLREQTSNHMTG